MEMVVREEEDKDSTEELRGIGTWTRLERLGITMVVGMDIGEVEEGGDIEVG